MKPLQLFDPASSTYTYLLIDPSTRDAIIIDPVDEQIERDLKLIAEHRLRMRYVVETHAHADHITSAAALIEHTGAEAATPAGCGIKPSALQLGEADVLHFGREQLTVMHTPGHTAGSICLLWRDHVFTGDTLLIGGCGRTDFQSGSAEAMYDSLTRLFTTLPPDMMVWPGHDYSGKSSSTIAKEWRENARFNIDGRARSREEFVALMNSLGLSRPKRLDDALPANLVLGVRHDASEAKGHLTPRPPKLPGYSGDITVQLAYDWWRRGEAILLDIRTDAERAWVGFIPDAPTLEWKRWPGMVENPEFDAALLARVPEGSKVMMLCRSGLRSVPAAIRAQSLGFDSYNILEGFEGDPDALAHRGRKGGWRFYGLPWRQN